VPNLIGYLRVITGLAAFYVAFEPAQYATFFWLYGFSYALDAVDGVAARHLKQMSRFGAVLDMVSLVASTCTTLL
jgi:CDP-diacylglycerol--inositol 3-phosphatidyltransferase